MKVLITGGAGYVGTPLAKALLEQGHEVTILDNFMFGYDSVLYLVGHPKLHVIKQDIRNQDTAYLKEPEAIFHLAAISGYPACEANPNSAQLINVEATRRIVKSLSKHQILLYASTTSLYGAVGATSTEDTPVTPASLYGTTKREAEQICLEHTRAISLRWATVFGVSPRMRAGLLMNDFVEKAVHEGALVLFKADSKRTFMHVNDSVKGYVFALNHADSMAGQIFNMGSERLNLSKRDIANAIRKYVKFEIVEAATPDKDVRDFYVSFAKAKAMGFDCDVDLDTGIRELVKLYRFYDPNSFIRPI